jgi:hypothetical protein
LVTTAASAGTPMKTAALRLPGITRA